MITVEVSRLDVTPNPAPLGAELNLEMDFTCDARIVDARWNVTYVVDMSSARHILEVGSCEKTTYEAGKSTLEFHADGIEIEGVKSSMLNNVGLLCATLVDGTGEEVVKVSMVTQVMKSPDGLERLIISPIED